MKAFPSAIGAIYLLGWQNDNFPGLLDRSCHLWCLLEFSEKRCGRKSHTRVVDWDMIASLGRSRGCLLLPGSLIIALIF